MLTGQDRMCAGVTSYAFAHSIYSTAAGRAKSRRAVGVWKSLSGRPSFAATHWSKLVW